MKKIIYFLSAMMAFTACKSYDPYQESDLINQTIGMKLDSLSHQDIEDWELYEELKEIQGIQENLVNAKKELFKDEKLEVFRNEVIAFKEFEDYSKIKEKIQRNQRMKYDRIMEGYYLKDNLDPYSVFSLDKDYDYLANTKTGSLNFYSRKGGLSYEIKNDLMYFEGVETPFFIKESSGKGFSLVGEGHEVSLFVKEDDNIVVLGDFEAVSDNKFYKFNISIVDYDHLIIDDVKYKCEIQREKGYYRSFYDEYIIKVYDIPQTIITDDNGIIFPKKEESAESGKTPTITILLSLGKDNTNENHFDGIASLVYHYKEIWWRKFKDMPANINEFLNEQ